MLTAEQPKPEAMRAFVLVSKVLQMIANGLSFSDKTSEAYMRDMNPFLDAHQNDVVAFFRAVAVRAFQPHSKLQECGVMSHIPSFNHHLTIIAHRWHQLYQDLLDND